MVNSNRFPYLDVEGGVETHLQVTLIVFAEYPQEALLED